jgi:hypothetical protein
MDRVTRLLHRLTPSKRPPQFLHSNNHLLNTSPKLSQALSRAMYSRISEGQLEPLTPTIHITPPTSPSSIPAEQITTQSLGYLTVTSAYLTPHRHSSRSMPSPQEPAKSELSSKSQPSVTQPIIRKHTEMSALERTVREPYIPASRSSSNLNKKSSSSGGHKAATSHDSHSLIAQEISRVQNELLDLKRRLRKPCDATSKVSQNAKRSDQKPVCQKPENNPKPTLLVSTQSLLYALFVRPFLCPHRNDEAAEITMNPTQIIDNAKFHSLRFICVYVFVFYITIRVLNVLCANTQESTSA